jgi:hypothetical protein
MYKILLIITSLFCPCLNAQENTISSSPSISSTSRTSPSPTTTCKYRPYVASTDFSNVQGTHGWYYGYYSGSTFFQFTSYGISSTGSVGSVNSWNYNINSNGIISANMIMQNGAISCNTPSYGNIAPVLRWYNPIESCYQDITINVILSGNSNSAGSIVSLSVNGASIYSFSGVLSINKYFNVYGVRSVELSVGPLNSNCDYGQTTYSLSISPIGPSITSVASISNIVSRTITNTPRPSSSNSISPSISSSATATATVFYYGNWTDLGQIDYAQADILPTPFASITIYQCQLNCWLNPLCGVIAVESPCNTISLDSPEVNTVVCPRCWIKLTSGWNIIASTNIKSIMLYDRVYPPTTTSLSTRTPTFSALPTSTVVTYSSWNFCSNPGKTITLPFFESSTNVMTNAVGATYGNSWSCSVYINGAGVSQGFQININNFVTEGGFDYFRIYNSAGTLLYIYSGNLVPFNLFITETSSIQLTFGSDGSNVGSGINAIISLVYTSMSGSPSQSASVSNSPKSTSSPLTSRSITNSASATSTVFYSGDWTDYGNIYWNNPIQNFASFTINQCMITCWLHPLCGGISVNYACANILLNSSNIYTTICQNCFITPKYTSMTTYIGAYYSNTAWKSFIIYDKIFPPTVTSVPSPTQTVSSYPTNSIVTSSTINYCSTWGTSVTLPFVGSSLTTMTNALGSNYVNNLGCSVNIYGAGNYQQFRINITSLNTEGCCDFFTIFDSVGTTIARYSGTTGSGTTLVINNSPFIRVVFTSDVSAVASGVFAIVTLEYASMSPSALPSFSSRNSISNSPSVSISKSPFNSFSNYPSVSVSQSVKSSVSTSYTPTPNYVLPFELPPPGKDYNAQVANQLNNYLSDLLSSGQQIPPSQALSVINNIPVLAVSDTMNILKKLSGLVTAPVSFTSSSFEGSLAPLKNASITVNSSTYGINVPVIPGLPPNSAITAISWTNTTSFSNETTLSNIMSVSVSNKGVDTSIKNLTTPLILNWNIPNIITPPNMTLKCSYWNYTSTSWNSDGCNITIIGSNIICSCSHMTDFVTRFERIAEMNKNLFLNAGNVYSLDGLQKYKNYYIFYGCYFLIMIIIGISLQQLDIKNSKQYLKSLKQNIDILKFKKEIDKFYIDKCYLFKEDVWEFDEYYEYKNYKNKIMQEIYNSVTPSIRKQSNFLNIMNILVDEKLEEKRIKDILNNETSEEKNKKESFCTHISKLLGLWWKRLLYQHNYLSIIFKYDPESPRIFRIFFIFTVISHTLFMTALLYGYVHDASGTKDNASPIEAIVLSIITSVINVPFLNLIVKILILAGKAEFEWRYPFIYREIKKMLIFEDVFYEKKKNDDKNKKKLDENDIENNQNMNNNEDDDLLTTFIVQILCKYCNRKDNTVKVIDKNVIFTERIDKEIIKINNIPYEYSWWFSTYLPFHTVRSFTSFFGCLGYLIWTINYLLLFTADAGTEIQAQIMKSFGISQLFSIVLITPMTLFFTLLFTWFYHKYIKKTNYTTNITPLYYHSDPYVNNKSFGLTVRLSKSLFLESIASSSIHQPTDYKIIAPMKGLIAELLKENIDSEINKEYYDKIIKYNEINKNIIV